MFMNEKQTLFVIFASPQNFCGPNLYYAEDGTTTDLRPRAAKFLTESAAKAFAEKHGIVVAGPIHVGREDYSTSELWG